MSMMEIENGIVIDDVETVVSGINAASDTIIHDPYVIKKFITTQKATKFYLDARGAMKMAPEKDTVYLWMDTGFVDTYGNPIFVSTLKEGGSYTGHYVGTKNNLANAVREYFRRNLRDINSNMKRFDDKYRSKISVRAIRHISNERQFFIDVCNGNGEEKPVTEIAKKLRALSVVFDDTVEDDASDFVEEPEAVAENPEIERSALDILWDKIDELEDYIATLLKTIEDLTAKGNEHVGMIKELQDKNEEYKRALVQMREYSGGGSKPQAQVEEKGDVPNGHKLLNGRKVLVLGATVVSTDVMKCMLKLYGFDKTDFDFETDYDKIKKYAGRVTTDGRYAALIIGANPHKTCDSNGWSSLVEKFKNLQDGPIAIDVRTSAGELKITKTSFKMAMEQVVGLL